MATLLGSILPARAKTVLSGSIQTRIEQIEQADAGPYTVEVAEGIKLADNKTGREIKLEICYPKEEGKFPVIVISHAAVVSGRDYRPLAAFWSSHGYICVSPSHQDALNTVISPGKKVSVFKLAKLANINDREMESREDDLDKILQGLDLLRRGIDGIREKMDSSRIACVGHQAGAQSVELLAAHIDGGQAAKLPDQRLKAIISLTGGLAPRSAQKRSFAFADITVPFMILDIRVKDKSNRVREKITEALKESFASDKLLVAVDLDSSIVKKPTFLEMRRAFKHSNISLINFRRPHIFKRSDEKQKQKQPEKNNEDERASESADARINHKVAPVESGEMPGEDLLALLGIQGQIFESTGRKKRINYVMSLTLPFLDAHLKGEREALNRLGRLDAQTFGPHVSTYVQRF